MRPIAILEQTQTFSCPFHRLFITNSENNETSAFTSITATAKGNRRKTKKLIKLNLGKNRSHTN